MKLNYPQRKDCTRESNCDPQILGLQQHLLLSQCFINILNFLSLLLEHCQSMNTCCPKHLTKSSRNSARISAFSQAKNMSSVEENGLNIQYTAETCVCSAPVMVWYKIIEGLMYLG